MKNSWFIWPFIIIGLMIVTGAFSGLILPLLVFLIIYRKLNKENRQSRPQPHRNVRSRENLVRLSGKQADLVNNALEDYFKTHETLTLLEEISLRPEKARYNGLRGLILLKGDDCIATLEDFGEQFPRVYNEIIRLLLKFAEQPQKQTEPVREKAPVRPEEKKKLDEAEEYIEKINSLNTEIKSESITNGLYQTVALLKHLAISEEKFPENKDKLDKLYDYYLPILLDILENYKNIGESGSDHSDFKEAEDRLDKTIILINEAMKTISTTMVEDDLMTMSADMSTLEALLKKDGLVREGTLSGMKK